MKNESMVKVMNKPLLYNELIKTEFLSSYPASTQKTYRSFLSKIKPFEEKLDKDISEFTQSELTQLLTDLEIDYRATARSVGRIITKYVTFAAENGYAHDVDEFFFEVKTKYFEQFALTNEKKIFFSKDEITEIELECRNAQDAVIINLIFNGVLGKAASELRNLKRRDIIHGAQKTIATLYDEDGSSREFFFEDPDSVDWIDKALAEKIYYKSNGQMIERDNVRNYTDLNDSDYVIRSSNTSKVKNHGAVDKYVIFRRIASIEKSLDLAHFTIKNIQRSGMLYKAYKILCESNGKVKKVNFILLRDVARIYKVESTRSLYTFITNENIEELYGEI
jgi:hypothetical protein